MDVLILIAGLAILVKSADFFVDGATAAARRLGISALVIGLTVVSFGTSAPELIVSIVSAIKGAPDVVVGNIIGSNISNVALILGISATLRSLKVQSSNITHEIPFGLLALVIVYILVQDTLLNNEALNQISRSDGLILLSFMLIFLYYIASLIRKKREEEKVVKEFQKEYGEQELPRLATWKVVLYLIGGIVGMTIGGKLAVDGAVNTALAFGLSEALIALTIVAVGTSLPELVTSVIAALKNESDIAIGNILGSNIFNIFFILGTSATIQPIAFSAKLNPDLLFMMGLTGLLFIFGLRGQTLARSEGISFIAIYVAYLAFLIWRG